MTDAKSYNEALVVFRDLLELYGEYVYERKAADLRAAINAHCES